MRHFAIAALLVGLAGCGGPGSRLVGSWEFDKEATTKAFKEELLNKQKGDGAANKIGIEFAERMMEGMLSSIDISMNFHSDGTFSGGVGAKKGDGKWEVISSSGDKMKIKIIDLGGSSEEFELRFIDANHIELLAGEDNNLVMKRK